MISRSLINISQIVSATTIFVVAWLIGEQLSGTLMVDDPSGTDQRNRSNPPREEIPRSESAS